MSDPFDRSTVKKSERVGPDGDGPDWKDRQPEPGTEDSEIETRSDEMEHADITNGERLPE